MPASQSSVYILKFWRTLQSGFPSLLIRRAPKDRDWVNSLPYRALEGNAALVGAPEVSLHRDSLATSQRSLTSLPWLPYLVIKTQPLTLSATSMQ